MKNNKIPHFKAGFNEQIVALNKHGIFETPPQHEERLELTLTMPNNAT